LAARARIGLAEGNGPRGMGALGGGGFGVSASASLSSAFCSGSSAADGGAYRCGCGCAGGIGMRGGTGIRGDGRAEADAGGTGVFGGGMRAALNARTECGSAITASVSVLRIASSSASRSRVMSASAIGGLELLS
jgi:hypothetical protein